MSDATSLRLALTELAQRQGASIDPLQLGGALRTLGADVADVNALTRLCLSLQLPAPLFMAAPDTARLPLLCLNADLGWGVIVDRDAEGAWVVAFASGRVTLATSELAAPVAYLSLKGTGAAGGGTFTSVLQRGLKSYRPVLVEASLASVFIGLLALATSLFSMQVYDRVIPTRSEYTLITLSLGVFIAVMLELGMKFARSHIMDYVMVGLDSRLSRDIFQRLLNVRLDQLPASVGSLAGQLRGYEQVRAYYTASTLFTLVDVPMGLIFLIIIAIIGSPWVALVPLVFGLIAVVLGMSLRRRIERLAAYGAEVSNLKTGLLVETVEGAETIKAGAGGWKFLSRWIDINALTIKNDTRLRGTSEGTAYLSATLQQLSYAGLVVVGSLVVMQGNMTMGALIACSILSGRIMAPIMAIPSLMVQRAHAVAATRSLERLYQLQTDNHGVDRPLVPTKLRGDFVANDLQFAYPGAPPALTVARLQIRAGERIAILGPIGAGKSTLLKLLSGIYRPQQGRLLLDGLDLAYISRQVVSQKIGYLQQDHRLFVGTLRENLLIGLPDPGDDVMQKVLMRSGLIRLVAGHPKGLELPIHEGGKGLSGGQRQLVAFTRLLLCQSSIWLLDEPTASMDEEQERRCIGVLRQEISGDRTFIVVTHKPSMLPLVDRVIVVANNQIVMDGPRDAIMARLQQQNAANQTTTTPAAPARVSVAATPLNLRAKA